ncbi:MAG: hypothetical protein LUG56_05325 [Lachnospiraceae bacterium]|nr:hypothetical protein [Lachnospiraceae bacterium]MCD7841874.1 hypothetical protein [Lachnospiraceae bacterium]
MNKNIRCAFTVAQSEYVKWITNPRIIITGVMLVFMKTLAVDPLLERAAKIGFTLDVLEPFVAIGNSGVLVMIMPCVFMVLISDYPKMTGNTLFFVQRTGRWNWFAGQILFLFYTILSFLFVVLIGGILLSQGKFTGTWSDVVTKYDALYPEEAGNFTSQLLPSNLYNQIPLITATVQTIMLMAAYMFLLAMVIYFFRLIHIQSFGLLFAAFVVAAGVITCSLKSKTMWCFPMANTIVWLHYDEILDAPIFPVWFSYAYFGITDITIMGINLIAVKRLEFTNIEQVE